MLEIETILTGLESISIQVELSAMLLILFTLTIYYWRITPDLQPATVLISQIYPEKLGE